MGIHYICTIFSIPFIEFLKKYILYFLFVKLLRINEGNLESSWCEKKRSKDYISLFFYYFYCLLLFKKFTTNFFELYQAINWKSLFELSSLIFVELQTCLQL